MKYIFILFLCYPFLSHADYVCNNIQQSGEVHRCSKKLLDVSDAELNLVYKRLLASIDKNYLFHIKEKNEYIQMIKFSQRAWIDFRDKNCAVRSYQIEVGTQAYESSLYACKDIMTQERIKELNLMIND